jgi:hypothetical protein
LKSYDQPRFVCLSWMLVHHWVLSDKTFLKRVALICSFLKLQNTSHFATLKPALKSSDLP